MHIEAWDAIFVRARRADVHPVLRDLAGYGRWWPGMTATALPGGAVRLRHDVPGMLRAAHTVEVAVRKDRTDLGVDLTLAGDLIGVAEWYYLDEVDGTTVHHLLRADTADRGWRRRLAAHRASVRAALNELKDRMEGDRVVGSEPDPQLLADQVAAAAAFAAGVKAHARLRAQAQADPE
jgi:hypothetical protein